jgi:hypothetical protein
VPCPTDSRKRPVRIRPTAIAEEIGHEVDYRDVEADGAARAAGRLVELLR